MAEGKVAGWIGVAQKVAAKQVQLHAGLDEVLAALRREAGLQRVIVAGLLLPADSTFQSLESAYADVWKILELGTINERLRKSQRRQIKAGGERLLFLFAVGESNTGIEDCAGADQIGIVDGDALVGPVHDVAAWGGESGEVIVEVEESSAGVGPYK